MTEYGRVLLEVGTTVSCFVLCVFVVVAHQCGVVGTSGPQSVSGHYVTNELVRVCVCIQKSRGTCVVLSKKVSVYERGRVHTRFQIGVVLGAGSYVCIYRTHSLPYSEYSHSVRYIYIYSL